MSNVESAICGKQKRNEGATPGIGLVNLKYAHIGPSASASVTVGRTFADLTLLVLIRGWPGGQKISHERRFLLKAFRWFSGTGASIRKSFLRRLLLASGMMSVTGASIRINS